MHESAKSAASHLVDQAAQSAEQALESTRRQADAAMDGLVGSVEDLRAATSPTVGRLADQASELAHDGLDAVRHGSQRLGASARRAGDATLRYVHHEPVKSLLLAAATGAALMALVSLVVGRRGRD